MLSNREEVDVYCENHTVCVCVCVSTRLLRKVKFVVLDLALRVSTGRRYVLKTHQWTPR